MLPLLIDKGKTMVYNESIITKEEKSMNTYEVVDNPMPDWSLFMFWEDITDLIQKFFDFIKSLF